MKTKIFPALLLRFVCVSVYFLTWQVLAAENTTQVNDPSSANTAEQKYFTTEAVSDKYELLLRYETLPVGKPIRLTLFVSDYATNKPVDKAELKITAQENSQIIFTAKQSGEGAYTIETTFPEKKTYSLAVSVNSNLGADLLLLPNVVPGKKVPISVIESPSNIFANWQTWLIVVLTLTLGIALGILLQKRNTAAGKTFSTILFFVANLLLPVQHTTAHEGHDEPTKSSNHFSNTFYVPKETQFLFDVLTRKMEVGAFSESTKLFGTIIPSSNGQAMVTTPQNGNIISLNVRVGEKVTAGQLLAVIEHNIEAGTQVNLLAEKNNLTAEYDAAKKEFDRLNSIKDIAAKRDVDEAAARLQKAKTNLKLFNSNSGKTISLQAPISGIIGNFKLSLGATVNAGETLFTITNLSQIYAEAQVFDKDAAKIQRGAKFTVECANDSHKASEVKLLSLAQEINVSNQSQRVLFELKNPEDFFKIGEFVNIRVFAPRDTKQMALPNSAITEINGKPVVFIKDAAEKYSVSYVQLGENNGTFTSIVKGVEEGERVVVNASYQLKMIYLNQ